MKGKPGGIKGQERSGALPNHYDEETKENVWGLRAVKQAKIKEALK